VLQVNPESTFVCCWFDCCCWFICQFTVCLSFSSRRWDQF